MTQDDLPCGAEVEIKSGPASKKIKLEYKPFALENDKLMKPLPDPFPFPENYSPEITVALTNWLMPPKTLEKFVTAVARAAFALKCYPTSKELERVAIQAIEKWEFLRAPQGSPFVSSFPFSKLLQCITPCLFSRVIS